MGLQGAEIDDDDSADRVTGGRIVPLVGFVGDIVAEVVVRRGKLG